MQTILLFIISLFLYYVYKTLKLYSYWKQKGVIGPTPVPLFGNYTSVFLYYETEAELLQRIYEKYPEKYIGIYKGIYPVLLVKDPCGIKEILLKNFDSFNVRCVQKSLRSYRESIFVMGGDEKWKAWRRILSPGLLSNRIEKMVPLIESSFKNNINELNCEIETHINDVLNKSVFEVFSKLIFNQDKNVLFNSQTFQDVITSYIKSNMNQSAIQNIEFIIPDKLTIITKFVHKINKTKNILKEFILFLINEIEKVGIKRNNFLEVMIGMKHDRKTRKDKELTFDIDNNVIIQQSLTYFIVGFESTSGILGFTLYELANNEDIQEKCVNEIRKELEGKEITLKTLANLTYLQMVIDETLRKHTLFQKIDRICTKKFVFPDGNLIIDKDISVYIPVRGLHFDPKYFPNPIVFDPQRLSAENINNLPQYVYLPFGEGPRTCIGIRLAKIIMLIGLAGFLLKYKVTIAQNKFCEMKYNPKVTRIMVPSDDIRIVLQRRKS